MTDSAASDEALTVALFWELTAADQLVRARLSRAMPSGMEMSHFLLLNLLATSKGERSPAQLAKRLHLTRGAITNTLSRLEQKGHIHVRPDWDDARQKQIAISPAGRTARDIAAQSIAPVFDAVVADLGPETVQALVPALRKLRLRLEEDQ